MHIEKSYADPYAARYHLVGDDGKRVGLAKVHHKEFGSGVIVAESYLGFGSYASLSQGELQRQYENLAITATHIQTPPEPESSQELALFHARQENIGKQHMLTDEQVRKIKKNLAAENNELKARKKTLAAETREARKATKH